MLIKILLDGAVCRYLYTAKSLYLFWVSQHPLSGVLKALIIIMMGAVTPEICRVTVQ